MEEYNFLYTCDQKYFPHLLTSIYSLALSHIDKNINIHIIEEGFRENEYRKLEELTTICQGIHFQFYPFGQIKNLIEQLQIPNWRGSSMANARLFAREVLPNLDKVLYIDSDTIIKDSLIEAFNQEIASPLSAVKEMVIPLRMQRNIPSYYNSGVVLFNYPEWDKENCFSILYNTALNNTVPLHFPDQDILNLALNERISPLDLTYNITPTVYDIMQYPLLAQLKFQDPHAFYSYEQIKSALDNPHIFHLLGTVSGRPWDNGNANPFRFLYEEYRTLWDTAFKTEDSKVLPQTQFVSFLNILCTACLPNNVTQQIKNKVRQKFLPK